MIIAVQSVNSEKTAQLKSALNIIPYHGVKKNVTLILRDENFITSSIEPDRSEQMVLKWSSYLIQVPK
jgi:hypothetical protein